MEEIQNDEISLKELIYKAKGWYGYLLTQWWKVAIAGVLGVISTDGSGVMRSH